MDDTPNRTSPPSVGGCVGGGLGGWWWWVVLLVYCTVSVIRQSRWCGLRWPIETNGPFIRRAGSRKTALFSTCHFLVHTTLLAPLPSSSSSSSSSSSCCCCCCCCSTSSSRSPLHTSSTWLLLLSLVTRVDLTFLASFGVRLLLPYGLSHSVVVSSSLRR